MNIDEIVDDCLKDGNTRGDGQAWEVLNWENARSKIRSAIRKARLNEEQRFEESEHVESDECWCKPEAIYEADNGNKVIVHKGNGEELPPPAIIAQAIADAIADKDD